MLCISFISPSYVSILIPLPRRNFKVHWTWLRLGQPSNDPLRIFRWNMMERLTVQVCDCRFGLKASGVIWVVRIFTGAGLRGEGSIAEGLIALTRKPAARVFLQK